jgi:hypothetical protein
MDNRLQLGQLGNLVMNKKNNQYSLTIRSKELNKLKMLPCDLLKTKIDIWGIKKK